MLEDKYLRIGLVASLLLNGSIVGVLGYSGALKAMSRASAPKPPATRLIEISMLADNNLPMSAHADDKKGPSGKGDEGQGGGGKEGALSDSDTGPMGKLNQGRLATEKRAEPPAPPKPLQVKKAVPKHAAQKGAGVANKPKSQTKRDIKLAMKANLKVNLGTMHLKKPGGLVTGGYHGVADLRNLKLSGHLIADVGKNPAKPLPNKYIGTSHIKFIGKTVESKGGVVCIPTGGHTIYASDMTIYLPLTSELTGTKFCIPGGAPGIPGSGSGGSLSRSNASQNQGYAVSSNAPKGESKKGTGVESATSQPKARVAYKASAASSGGGEGSAALDGPSKGTGASDDTQQAQQALQNKYEKLAKGPVRETGDQVGGGGLVAYDGGAPTRTLHLPEFHNDPTDRIPGVWVPEDQRREVVSPKAHRGSAAQLEGAAEQTDPKITHFELTPISVGSHSTRGTVPWAPDSAKATKHKASRRVKGDGKEDGGGDGSGLMGTYYLGENFEREVMSRPDKNIDFDWSGWRPDKRIPYPHPFSVRWKGKIRAKYSELYTIYCASDDGARLWLDGRLVFSNWTVHAATEDTIQARFEAGKEYDFKLEYFENDTDPAIMRLYWESPSQPKEYIPQSCFVYPKPR